MIYIYKKKSVDLSTCGFFKLSSKILICFFVLRCPVSNSGKLVLSKFSLILIGPYDLQFYAL